VELYEFFTVAIIYTVMGLYWGLTYNKKAITGATIDELIKTGYLKTRGTGKNLEILKHNES
jgi:hypothetical protein